jgi:NAD(P)-dependent dehydrogenase (short-subunit alcohol dehydrogenase family)
MEPTSKIAMVTGAGTGIGRQVSLSLCRAGYSVVLVGRRRKPLEEVAREGERALFRTLVVQADVVDPDSVRAAFARVKDAFGRLDLLFNNAGVGAPDLPMEELSDEDWSLVVGVNLSGSFFCIREAFRLMKAQDPQGGRIINNGSISAYTPRPNSAPYTATKHAVTGLTKSAALDGRKYNIACGQIDIGNAHTTMTEDMKSGVLQADGSVAMEPTIHPEDVAKAVLLMATLPLDANVLFMTVMATAMPFVGRG